MALSQLEEGRVVFEGPLCLIIRFETVTYYETRISRKKLLVLKYF
jgi:hypothetical protein